MIRLFIGRDDREAVGLIPFYQSLREHTSQPISVTELTGLRGDGTNDFATARFYVPHLCGFRGLAVWMDGSDMLLRADLGELVRLFDFSPVQVVKHAYFPKNKRKYIGTEMEADNEGYPCKNWSSVMLWNCEHPINQRLTESFVKAQSGRYLHRFMWMEPERVGELPKEWNWLDEYGYNADAKLVHLTNGIPGFIHYRDAPHAEEWWSALRKAQRGLH